MPRAACRLEQESIVFKNFSWKLILPFCIKTNKNDGAKRWKYNGIHSTQMTVRKVCFSFKFWMGIKAMRTTRTRCASHLSFGWTSKSCDQFGLSKKDELNIRQAK